MQCVPIDVSVCVLQDPDEAIVQVGVHSLHVLQGDGLPQQLLVEGQRKAAIDVVAVEHCHAHDAPHEVEVRQVLLGTETGSGGSPGLG